ncbi:MAG: hypothetical protein A2039_03205 [Candidatus Melainabacteria bacterium GWA2_34_9]|nr:MAG: hypothetical protein A2039_03205 [Candidatus Melainabacteria bacterium GWA2_34_9]
MSLEQITISAILFFLIATLYSSVGHAGASGYLAVMSFMSFSSVIIKPTSLILNILVSLVASYKYISAKYYKWEIFWPFAITSMPFAFIGGYLNIDEKIFKIIAGIFLIISSILLILRRYIIKNSNNIKKMPKLAALIIGAAIGFFSGIIGVGGGIFLSPILILLCWSSAREASGVAAIFILLNSITALLGKIYAVGEIPALLLGFSVPSVVIGGIIGATLGTKVIDKNAILTILSIILILAGIKMLVSIF